MENDPTALKAGATEVVVGGPAKHEMVKLGVARFLRDRFRGYVHLPVELTRLYRDLQYAKQILEEALRDVTSAEVHRNVCPACPYPEALLRLGFDDAHDEFAEGSNSESQ